MVMKVLKVVNNDKVHFHYALPITLLNTFIKFLKNDSKENMTLIYHQLPSRTALTCFHKASFLDTEKKPLDICQA